MRIIELAAPSDKAVHVMYHWHELEVENLSRIFQINKIEASRRWHGLFRNRAYLSYVLTVFVITGLRHWARANPTKTGGFHLETTLSSVYHAGIIVATCSLGSSLQSDRR